MSERAEEFLEEDYFNLILDCKRELPYIVSAMQEYAEQEVENFVASLDTKLYIKIRGSQSDAECRRYLKEFRFKTNKR